MWGKSHCFKCCFVIERKMDPSELGRAGLGWAGLSRCHRRRMLGGGQRAGVHLWLR